MPRRRPVQDPDQGKSLRVLRIVSATLQYNSDGRSVAVKTIVMSDGKQHTFKAELDGEAEEILLSTVNRLIEYAQ